MIIQRNRKALKDLDYKEPPQPPFFAMGALGTSV